MGKKKGTNPFDPEAPFFAAFWPSLPLPLPRPRPPPRPLPRPLLLFSATLAEAAFSGAIEDASSEAMLRSGGWIALRGRE